MKKLLSNRKVWIGLAMLAGFIILFLLIRKKNPDGTMGLSMKDPETPAPADPWAGLRESLGDWSRKADDDKMWTAAGNLFLPHIDSPEQKNAQIPPYWRAMYAWFKGYNIRPDGYQVIINQSLRKAIIAFVEANPGVTQATVSVGQFIGA